MDLSLLSPPVQKSVWKMGWKNFTPIQEKAIPRIMNTQDNYILASATASGKTEAVFLPILSLMDVRAQGVQTLYISPLRALINDQFLRIEKLCRYLQLPVTKWHSDVKDSHKNQLLNDPRGILQITPESIEALFMHHPDYLEKFFKKLEFIIIDELHSFLGTGRGTHLLSLLERLRYKMGLNPRLFGLSATLKDFSLARTLMQNTRKTFILKIEDQRPLKYHLMHFPGIGEISPELIQDIYSLTQRYRTLIFTNSRGRAEEVAVLLKKTATAQGGHSQYFSHHSSISREEREWIETSLREKDTPLGVCCTSTLELGIDIGTMDLIIQLDATYSVSSLIQRLGRSGRKKGMPRMLQVYSTDSWNLLQSTACIELFREGLSDSPIINQYPLDILFQQILSTLVEKQGMKRKDLCQYFRENRAFQEIQEEDIQELIHHMIHSDFIQDLRQELILGLKGERLLNNRQLYATFDSPQQITIFHGREQLGALPFSPQLREGENISLGARMWKIHFLDLDKNKIYVKPTTDGKPPLFYGHPLYVHPCIREKMIALLYNGAIPAYVDEGAAKSLRSLQEIFQQIPLQETQKERPYFKTSHSYRVFTFTGSRINHTLLAALVESVSQISYNAIESSFTIDSEFSLPKIMERVQYRLQDPKNLIYKISPSWYFLSPWSTYLPFPLQAKWLLHNYFDFPGTQEYLANTSFLGVFHTGP